MLLHIVGEVVLNRHALFVLHFVDVALHSVYASGFLSVNALQVLWLSVLGVETPSHDVPVDVLLVFVDLLFGLEKAATALPDAEPVSCPVFVAFVAQFGAS